MRRQRLVLLAALLVAASGCHRVDKKEQLAALDNAYSAGLMTKDEYEAKKAAITGAASSSIPAALPSSVPASSPPPVALPSPPDATTTPEPASKRAASAVPVPHRHAHPSVTAAPVPASAPVASAIAPAAAIPPKTNSSTESSAPGADLHANEPAPLPGCEDAEYKSGGQKGSEERFFAAPPDRVRSAAMSALDGLDFNIHKKSDREIEASKKRHLGAIVGAGGERVILTFEASQRKGANGTVVTGRTKKHFVGYMAQKTWTDAVLAEIACKLADGRR